MRYARLFFSIMSTVVLVVGCTTNTASPPKTITVTIPRTLSSTESTSLPTYCNFLRQTREQALLRDYKTYSDVVPAVSAIYGLPETEVDVYVGSASIAQPTRAYRWFTVDPYFGTIQHFADSNENNLLDIGSYSIDETPPSFTLGAVLTCLGTPTYIGSFFFTPDDIQYEESVRGFALLYRDLDLSVNLARPRADEQLTPDTKCYLLGIDQYPVGNMEETAQAASTEGWEREAWPPSNWSPTP